MQIKKNEISKIFTIFLFSHLIIWTVVPSLLNSNLPLDTIEHIAWGNGWPLGWEKHPPLNVWFPELVYQIFGSQDWAFYLLSQVFVVSSFIIIFKFSQDFFQNQFLSLISVLLLESIFFYNFTTPEFNVNVCPLPFWSLTVFYCWKAIQKDKITDWLLFGIFAAFGILSKYLFFYLLAGIVIFFIITIFKNKKINFKYIFPIISCLIVVSPHIFWLVENNYITINYGIFRSVDDPLSGFGDSKYLSHIFYPMIFLIKQIGILSIFFTMIFFIVSKLKIRINYNDKKLLFLISITVVPIILMLLTSMITGARIRTMGMAPFYLFIGVFFVYIFQNKIYLRKVKNLLLLFVFVFFLSPVIYYISSVTQKDKRTDYPGKKISLIVQTQWDNNFSNNIEQVVGFGWIDGWFAQNLSYHLPARPKWVTQAGSEPNIGTVWIKDFNKINECNGVLYQIKNFNDICMFGKK